MSALFRAKNENHRPNSSFGMPDSFLVSQNILKHRIFGGVGRRPKRSHSPQKNFIPGKIPAPRPYCSNRMATSNPHPKTIINNKKAASTYDDEELIHMGAQYLQDASSKFPKCLDLSKRTPKACNCMQRFGNHTYDYCLQVSRYMIHFARKDKFDQQMIVIDWIRYAGVDSVGRSQHCRFHVPALRTREEYRTLLFEPDVNNGIIELTSCCNFALMTILGYGLKFWRTCNQHAVEWTTPSHGLTDRQSNNSIKEESQMELHLFFADVELHAEPTPMRFIREKTGTLTERDKTDIKLLPPYFTKRSLYRRYCFDLGWNTSTNCTGSPNKKVLRNDEEWQQLQREEGQIVQWSTFLRFWAVNYPALKVGKPSEDICNACHKYCNQLKFNQGGTGKDDNDEESDDDGVDEREAFANSNVAVEPGVEVNDDPTLLCVTAVAEKNERIILEAKQHVEDAKVMREYANDKMKEARANNTDDLPWAQKKDCLVADFCQNMALPYLGMTQPGDTYYYSPLTVNCFGTADAGQLQPSMRAYNYHEGDAKKGANNVTSLLYKDFEDRGWIDFDKGPREELTVIMDNCGGQNKNKMVLRMLLFLTERGIYRRINACFLVAGHTKNVCDRLFNLLKLTYRQQDIFVFPQLIECLNTADDVTAVRVGPEDFYDWDNFENKLYRQIASGTVTRTHLFMFDADKPGMMVTMDTVSPNSHREEQHLRNRMERVPREHLVNTYKAQLERLQPPGIKPIKQWELWHKWRPFIPVQYQAELCPQPSGAICESQKERTREAGRKAAEKKRAAKRQREGNSNEVQGSNRAETSATGVDSTQSDENSNQRTRVSHSITLDSVTARLNPSSPS